LGSKRKFIETTDFCLSKQLFEVGFPTFYGQKKLKIFKNILASALKSYIKKAFIYTYFFSFFSFKKLKK